MDSPASRRRPSPNCATGSSPRWRSARSEPWRWKTFRHLHALSLGFHLERQTGGLTRAIERGAKGIEFLLSFLLFNVIPTLVEIGMVAVILWALYDWRFAAITVVTIGLYIFYTLSVTEWRIKLRRQMNESDQSANTKAVDSLLNFETVKYFNNEEHEAQRYDGALKLYETAAVRSRTSLAALNIGQVFIIAIGSTLIMALAASGVIFGDQGRHLTVGGRRAGQCLSAAALSAAELPRHGLPRDPPVADRHGGDVRAAGDRRGDRGQAGCRAACRRRR